MLRIALLCLALLVAPPVWADRPVSAEPHYLVNTSGACTAAFSLQVESTATLGFELKEVCVSLSNATAAAAVTVTVRRTTAASTGGTLLTPEATGTGAVSKLNPSDGNYPGVVRVNGTTTNGATLDQWGQQIGEIGAGAADPPGPPLLCKRYPEPSPIIAEAGVANGISVAVSSLGAGALASCSISTLLAIWR